MSFHLKGLTFVKFLVGLAVLGVVLEVLVPNVIALQNRRRDAITQINMKSVELGIEDFFDRDGTYPNNPGTIKTFTRLGVYARKDEIPFRNPFTRDEPEIVLRGVWPDPKLRYNPGTVIVWIPSDSLPLANTAYVIYGVGHDGRLLDHFIQTLFPTADDLSLPGL